MPIHGIAFHPAHNSHGKRDATGAFIPEARRFARLHGAIHVRAFDNRRAMYRRRAEVLEALAEVGDKAHRMCAPLDLVAFFCHGWRNGLQAGFRLKDVDQLAEAMALVCRHDVRVALYACDAGRDADRQRSDDTTEGPGGDGGFADELRDALCRAGLDRCQVDAHVTAGHTTRNPWLRRFSGDGSPVGGQGGGWVVRPRSQLWRPWKRALRGTDLRLRFPMMETAQIHAELVG